MVRIDFLFDYLEYIYIDIYHIDIPIDICIHAYMYFIYISSDYVHIYTYILHILYMYISTDFQAH